MKCEVTSDGKTVWVNSELGFLVARFTVNLYEIYIPDQNPIGKPGPLTLDDWISFKETCIRHFDVLFTTNDVPKSLRKNKNQLTQDEIEEIKHAVWQRRRLLGLSFEDTARRIGVGSYDLTIFNGNTAVKAKKWLDDVLWDD